MQLKGTLTIASLWAVSIAAAYYLGNSSNTPAAPEATDTASASTNISTRSASTITHASHSGNTISSSASYRSSSSGTSSPSSTTLTAISEINSITDPLERSRRMLSYIETLSAGEFEEAVANFRATGMARERSGEYAMLLHAWGKLDPLGALTYATENTKGKFASQEILAAWASIDANAALNWARENHTGTEANPFLAGVARGLVSTNPNLATQVLQELPFSEERGRALRQLIPYISQWGIERADQWLSGIDDPRLAAGAADQLASRFARQDPVSAAQWASSLAPGDARTRAIDEVVEHWTKQSPSEVQSWLDTLDYEERLNASTEFVNSLAEQDATAAADWLDQHSNAPNYQELLKEFAQGATSSDPILALNYGNELDDSDARSRTVGRALWTLYKRDKDSARNWIRNNELPERVARYVDKMLED